MASRSAVVTALLDAAARRRLALESQVEARVADVVSGFSGWYSDDDVAALAGRVGALVLSGQRSIAGLTDAYLARVMSEMTGREVRPRAARPAYSQLRAGQDPGVVYMRLGPDYRYRVSQGSSASEALAASVARASAMAQMDMSLAHRWTARESMRAAQVTHYRRVIRPEASAGGSCGLCAAASDRTYSTESLMPLHERCHCEVLPALEGDDPGRDLNEAELKSLYDAAGSTKAADLKRIRVSVHEHGELGPVLRVKGQQFRGPSDLT